MPKKEREEHKMEMVSINYAKKFYEYGKQYQHCSSIKAAIREACEDGIEVDCWEAAGAFRVGFWGNPFDIRQWKRYGNMPVNADGWVTPSINHADNEPELGVSVADDEWEASFRGQISKCRRRKVVYFEGLMVGYGSDGEPVVLPLRI
jgi:hypothetical protein